MNKLKLILLLLFVILSASFAACNLQIKYEINFYVDEVLYDTVSSDGNNISMPKDPTKSGYTFDGWFYDENVWEKPFTLQSLLDQSLTENNKVKLYAKFIDSQDVFVVTFNTESETLIAQQYVDKGECAVVPTEIPRRYGYIFLKWDFDFSTPIINNTIVNAVWAENHFKINYLPNEGVGSMPESIVEPDVQIALPLNKFERIGYTFIGWRFGQEILEDGQDIINLTMSGNVVNLIAEWRANQYFVNYEKGDENVTGSMSNQVFQYDVMQNLTMNNFYKHGYSFAGWSYDDTIYMDGERVKNLAQDGTITLTAIWKPFEFTLKYEGNGATYGSSFSQKVVYDLKFFSERSIFGRVGYKFVTWQTESGLEVQSERLYDANIFLLNDSTLEDGEIITLYAVWEANTYEINYRMYNYSFTRIQKVSYDEEFALEECPSSFNKSGYVFYGWEVPGIGVCYPGDLFKNLTYIDNERIKVYARWEAISYTLTFDVLDGVCDTLDDVIATYDSSIFFNRPEPVKEGYTFVGYHYQNIFLGKNGKGIRNLTTIEGDVLTLRALYQYNYNGKGTEEMPYILDTAESVSALSDFMLADYYAGESKNINAYFKLKHNIDMQGALLSPICDGKSFQGVFDGNMFTISNFEIIAGLKGYSETNLGFFAQNSGIIKCLSFENIKIIANKEEVCVGSVIGYNVGGRVEYCEVVNSEIIFTKQHEERSVTIGGLVGTNNNSVMNNETIIGSKFIGIFRIDGSNVQELCFGGLAGVNSLGSQIKYCYVDYNADISNASLCFFGILSPYDYQRNVTSTLATFNVSINTLCLNPTNLGFDETLNVYYSKDSKIRLNCNGQESNPLQDINLVDKDNYKNFDWVSENVKGFLLAKWEFDGDNYPFVSENPTQLAPKAISSVQEFLALSGRNVNGSYYLTCDIDLGGNEWIPFDLYGVLDGKGYKIHNFVITGHSDCQDIAFIGKNYGEISSLYLSDYSINVTIQNAANIGYSYVMNVGALVAHNYGVIKFVKADGYINIDISTDYRLLREVVVGGLVAVNYGEIYSSYVVADIVASVRDNLSIGGLVGKGAGGYGQVVNCYTTGSIAGQSKKSEKVTCGGIVGQKDSYQHTLVKNSFTTCNMRLIGNNNPSQIYTIAEFTENCYSSQNQKIIYNGNEISFAELNIVDDSNFSSYTFLKNKLNFDSFFDNETLLVDYTKAWLLQNNEFPKLYFENQ